MAEIKECLTVFTICMNIVIQTQEKATRKEIKDALGFDNKFKQIITNFYYKAKDKII